MKVIKHIFDGDFGCEEQNDNSQMVSLTLEDEKGRVSYFTLEDAWLSGHNLAVGSKWPEYLDRIYDMETVFNKVVNKIKNSPDKINTSKSEIEALKNYYGSQLWKSDFALDEAGQLPDSLKRGVLSEDGIYNILEQLEELDDDI